jgi:3-oxoacyl-[acyl-carrier protein] reductase
LQGLARAAANDLTDRCASKPRLEWIPVEGLEYALRLENHTVEPGAAWTPVVETEPTGVTMDLGISGRRAIVCASSRGLGKACALSLARNGVHVTLNGRDEDVLAATAAEIEKAAPEVEVRTVAGSVSDRQCQQALLDATPNADILVNNNGGPPFRDFRELDRDALIEGVMMNMVTPIEMMTAVIDGMAERQFGRIVNITSISVKKPVLGLDLSSGARAGLTAFLAGVSRSVANNNVTINNVLPGFFNTDRLRDSFDASSKALGISVEEAAAARAEQIPARRFGEPEEFGEACAFLCSTQAGYITGQNLLLDGGLFESAF